MVKLDFFVEQNSKDSDEIQKIVTALDDEVCSYKIHALNQSEINGKGLPILKLTLSSGEILEYDKENIFNAILILAKIGI